MHESAHLDVLLLQPVDDPGAELPEQPGQDRHAQNGEHECPAAAWMKEPALDDDE